MATKTTNYNLTKPAYDENADIKVINDNMDIIDAKMKEIEDKAGSGGSVTIDSELSDTSENPVQNKVLTAEFNNINNEFLKNQNLSNAGIPFAKLSDGRTVYIAYVSKAFNDSGTDYTIKHIMHDIADIDTVLGYHFDISGYNLPYFESGVPKTYVATVGKASIDYANSTNWGGDYTIRGFVYYVKAS